MHVYKISKCVCACRYVRVCCANTSTVYSHFTISSPDCALHTALAHVINVLGIVVSRAKRHRYSCETPPFQCFNHVSDCSVQCAIRTINCEMTVALH